MHELSIVASIVDTVTESLASYPGTQVQKVHLRVGELQSVVVDSLEFCWGIATEKTALEGSKLAITALPVIVHCHPCNRDVQLESVQSFRCPICSEPSMDVRQGRELEVESVEIEEVGAAK